MITLKLISQIWLLNTFHVLTGVGDSHPVWSDTHKRVHFRKKHLYISQLPTFLIHQTQLAYLRSLLPVGSNSFKPCYLSVGLEKSLQPAGDSECFRPQQTLPRNLIQAHFCSYQFHCNFTFRPIFLNKIKFGEIIGTIL